MKYGALVLSTMVLFASAGLLYADEKAAGSAATTTATGAKMAAPIEVGNKICPISGHEVGKMGKPYPIEYKGKVYNLCCAMCEKDFKKDPEAAIKKLDGMTKAAAPAAAPAHK